VAEYQAKLMELLQSGKAGMEEIDAMSTPEMVEEYIRWAAALGCCLGLLLGGSGLLGCCRLGAALAGLVPGSGPAGLGKSAGLRPVGLRRAAGPACCPAPTRPAPTCLCRGQREELEAQAKFLLAVDDIFDLEGLAVRAGACL
jgi:hypothetical protein